MEMNNKPQEQHEYNEISLKELIMTLINERRVIAIITLATLFLSAIFTFLIVSPKYEATSELIIKTPTPVETRYGIYSFPSENINDYIQYIYSNDVVDKVIKNQKLEMTRAGFREMIRINFDSKTQTNRFQVIVSHPNPAIAKAINDELLFNYTKSLRIAYKRNAVERFIKSYEVSIDTLQQSISQTEAILGETKKLMDSMAPIYTLQKALFSDPKAAAAYADTLNLDLSSLSEHVIIEEYANENYFVLQSQVIDYNVQLIGYNESLLKQKNLYAELLSEKKALDSIGSNGGSESVLEGKLDVFSTHISVISPAYVPERAVSPKKALNLAVGLLLGLMIGIFVALFKAYWKSN